MRLFLVLALVLPLNFAGAEVIQQLPDVGMEYENSAKIDQVQKELEQQKDKILAENSGEVDKALKKSEEISSKFMNKLNQLTIEPKVKIALELTSGASVVFRPTIMGTEPSYMGGYTTRFDRHELFIPLKWQDIIKSGGNWYLETTPRLEVSFFQYFETAKEARKRENFYGPSHTPLSAHRVLTKLKEGDLAHMRVALDIKVGARKTVRLGSVFALKGDVGHTNTAQVDVYVFRAHDNKVRVRAIARRDDSWDGELKSGIYTGPEVLTSQLKRKGVPLLDLDKILFNRLGKQNPDIFMVDYTLTLTNENTQEAQEVRDAFDDFMARTFYVSKYDDTNKQDTGRDHSGLFTLLNFRSSREQMRDILMKNVQKLDTLARTELGQDVIEARRVVRNNAVSNGGQAKYNNFEAGISGLIRYENYFVRRDNYLAMSEIQDEDAKNDAVTHVFFPAISYSSKLSALLSSIKEATFRTANVIYDTDEKFNLIGFKSLGFYYDYTDKTYRNGEHQDTLRHFKQVLPNTVYQGLAGYLEDKGFTSFKGKLKTVRVTARYFINQVGIKAVESYYSDLDYADRVEAVKKIILTHIENAGKPRGISDADLARDIQEIADKLAIVIDANMPPLERHRSLDKLAGSGLFRVMGPGFLYTLIPEDVLIASTAFEVLFHLPGQVLPLVYETDTKADERELYQTIIDVQRILNEDEQDLRLDGVVDNLTTRKTKNMRPPMVPPAGI